MKWAQAYLAVSVLLNLLINLYFDVNGRPEKKRGGYGNVVASLIAFATMLWLLWVAGAMSQWLPR